MKNILKIIVLFISFALPGQVVYDYAGVSTQEGFTDSTKLKGLLNNPHGLHVDELGNLYIADRFNHSIRKVDTSGNMITLAGTGVSGSQDGPAAQATFFEPWDITTDKEGNVYVADAKNNKIRKISVDGLVTTFAGTGSAGFKDHITPASGTFFWPSGIEYDAIENAFYIAGHRSHLIRKIDIQHGLTTLAGSKINFPNNFGVEDGIGSKAKFYRPYGIHIGDDNFIYVADEWNSNIRKISKQGIVQTIGGIDTAGYQEGEIDTSTFNFPWDITTDKNNNIYILDGFNHVIRIIDPITHKTERFAGVVEQTGGTNTELLESTFNGATGLAYNRATGQLFIADAYNHVIRAIDLLEQPKLLFSQKVPYCEDDSVTVVADIDYYDQYFWYINNVFVQSTEVNQMIFLPQDSTVTIKLFAQRMNGLFSPEAYGEFNKLYDPACVTIPEVIAKEDDVPIPYYQDFNFMPSTNDEVNGASFTELSVLPITNVPSGFELINNTLKVTDWQAINQKVYTIDYQICDLRYDNSCDTGAINITIELDPIIAQNDIYSIEYESNIYESPLDNDATNGVWEKEILIRMLTPEDNAFQIDNKHILIENWNSIKDSTYVFDYELCYLQFPAVCDTATVRVDILNKDENKNQPYVFANAFSPNNDGINDYFVIEGLDRTNGFSLFIYNRWGEEVKTIHNYKNSWDGTQNQNKPLSEGTYFYVLTNQNLNYSGYVLLYR